MKYKIINNKYKEFTLNIKSYVTNSNTSIHKARNEIKIVRFEENEYAVKAFKVPDFVNIVAYAYFNSKAKKSYENSVKRIKFVSKSIAYFAIISTINQWTYK